MFLKGGKMIIAGKDCEDCAKSVLDETNKAKIMVYCGIRDKWYIWGASIPCEDKIKVRNNDD